MNFLQQALSYIFTAANWVGPAGLAAGSQNICSTPSSRCWCRR